MPKVQMNFRVHDSTRDKFNEIVWFKLHSDVFSVLELFIESFIEEWKDPEKRQELTNKYGNKLSKKPKN
jgi:hypothetical protein